MRKNLLLLVILFSNYIPGITQPLTQTKTATYLNNLNNFRQVFGHQNYQRATAGSLSADDGLLGCSNKLVAIKDSTSNLTSKSVSSLSLQGFGFTIPIDATITTITVKVRRYKNGVPSVGDHTLSVMQRYDCNAGTPCRYGVFWTYKDDYPGKIYPSDETEHLFSQNGSGSNGGFNHDQSYQWTPAIVNHQYFGVRIDNYAPIGKGSVAICYDLVEITVEYYPAVSPARKYPGIAETQVLKQPIVYPNPVTQQSTLQFTAAESGTTTVEVYNITGAKIKTIFSRNVVKGQVYTVAVGEHLLSRGTYLYRVVNGQQKFTGKLIKME